MADRPSSYTTCPSIRCCSTPRRSPGGHHRHAVARSGRGAQRGARRQRTCDRSIDRGGHGGGGALRQGAAVEEQLAMIQVATRHLNSYGITSVVNATGDLGEIKLYAALRDRGELTVRTRTASAPSPCRIGSRRNFSPIWRRRAPTTTMNGCRRTWSSSSPTASRADRAAGVQARQYRALVVELDRRGYQLMTHATRFDTVHMVLDAYEEVERPMVRATGVCGWSTAARCTPRISRVTPRCR